MRRMTALLLLPLLAGCGAGKGKVSGLVRFNGAPLPGGMVTFQPANPKFNAVTALIDENGHYEATLPVGEVQISVDNRDLEPRSKSAGGLPPGLPASAQKQLGQAKPAKTPPPADNSNNSAQVKQSGKYVRIPQRYYQIETSKLQFTVEPGDHPHDIDLTR
jgi:hypothetical protein